MCKLQEQLDWLQEYVQRREHSDERQSSATTSVIAAGREFALREVLCHNDLLCGNILYQEQSADDTNKGKEKSNYNLSMGQVFLIDYEYAAYNYRAFDLANHLSGKQTSMHLIIVQFMKTTNHTDYMYVYMKTS